MKAFDSWKAFFITVGLIVFVVSLNVIMHRLAPVRWDTTSGDVYTLTKGTRSILKKAKDSGRPITIRFYLSNEEDAQLPKELIEYSKRVQDLLAEYAKASSSTVVVQTYSPVPNSEEEDAAELDNILRRDPRADMPQDSSLDEFDFNQRGRASEPYYFGLSISSLQNIETIPFLDPKQESNLEYQLSRAISSVIRKERRKIGLLEGNEMALGGQGGMMGGPSRPPSTIYRYLSRDFDIVPIPFDVQPMKPGDEDHPFADLDLLLIVHPVKVNRPQSAQPGMPPMGSTTLEGLSKQSQYAIDQYLVNGGKAIAFLDNQHFVSRFFDVYSAALPYELNDRHPAWYKDLYNLFQSNGWANYRSGLEDLYEAWGVSLGEKAAGDPIIYDPKYTRPVSYDRPINQLVQREFRLMNQLRQIPNEGVYREIVSTMGRGRALMVNFEDDALNKDHPVTRGLKAVRMVDPSPIIGKPAGNLSMKTLVRSSGKAKAIPGDTANLILNRSRTLDQVTSGMQALSQKPKPYPVAVLLEGNFRSAWEEDPTKEPDPEDNPPTPIPPNPITPPLLPGPVTAPPVTAPPSPEPTPPPAPKPAPESTPEPSPAPESEPCADEPAEERYPNPQAPEAEDSAPLVDPPKADPPKADPPKADPPKADPPKADPPNVDPPTVDPPTVDPPTVDPPNVDPPTEIPLEEEKEEDHHLKVGTKEGSLAIISDVDMLFDFFLGNPEAGAARDHDNIAFILNLVETLAGEEDLANIRGRDSTSRNFTVINDIREQAAKRAAKPRLKIREKRQQIDKERMNLFSLEQTEQGLMIAQDPEKARNIQKMDREARDLQREENKIDREQRREVEAAISRYEWWNMLLTPTIVVILGLIVGLIRKLNTAAK